MGTYHSLAPITTPTTAGTLEYPNAFDASSPGAEDAWSILDAERWLTLWLQGRRTWDLHRSDHPFLVGGIVFWDAEPRRASCLPVPLTECQTNPNLQGMTLLTGVGAGTHTCS